MGLVPVKHWIWTPWNFMIFKSKPTTRPIFREWYFAWLNNDVWMTCIDHIEQQSFFHVSLSSSSQICLQIGFMYMHKYTVLYLTTITYYKMLSMQEVSVHVPKNKNCTRKTMHGTFNVLNQTSFTAVTFYITKGKYIPNKARHLQAENLYTTDSKQE